MRHSEYADPTPNGAFSVVNYHTGMRVLLFFLTLLPAAAQSRISWNFEGGNLGRVESLSPHHLRAHLAGETDQDKRNRQANWYYFQVDTTPNTPVTIDLASIPGEYNYKPNRGAVTADTPPTFLLHAMDDEAVPPENSLMLHGALRAAGVPVEAHFFQEGGHGFGIRLIQGKPAAVWPDLVLAWGRRNGWLGE